MKKVKKHNIYFLSEDRCRLAADFKKNQQFYNIFFQIVEDIKYADIVCYDKTIEFEDKRDLIKSNKMLVLIKNELIHKNHIDISFDIKDANEYMQKFGNFSACAGEFKRTGQTILILNGRFANSFSYIQDDLNSLRGQYIKDGQHECIYFTSGQWDEYISGMIFNSSAAMQRFEKIFRRYSDDN